MYLLDCSVNVIELPAQQASGTPDGYQESQYTNYPNNPIESDIGTVFDVSGWGTKQFGLFEPLSDVLLKTSVAYVPDSSKASNSFNFFPAQDLCSVFYCSNLYSLWQFISGSRISRANF
jgi:hypothetical protein